MANWITSTMFFKSGDDAKKVWNMMAENGTDEISVACKHDATFCDEYIEFRTAWNAPGKESFQAVADKCNVDFFTMHHGECGYADTSEDDEYRYCFYANRPEAYTVEKVTHIFNPKHMELSDDGKILIKCDLQQKVVEVPEGVEEIADSAFFSNENVCEVHLPDSLKVIGNAAFCCCTKLSKINIPYGVEELGNSVFDDCYSLGELKLPKSVKKIGIYLLDEKFVSSRKYIAETEAETETSSDPF